MESAAFTVSAFKRRVNSSVERRAQEAAEPLPVVADVSGCPGWSRAQGGKHPSPCSCPEPGVSSAPAQTADHHLASATHPWAPEGQTKDLRLYLIQQNYFIWPLCGSCHQEKCTVFSTTQRTCSGSAVCLTPMSVWLQSFPESRRRLKSFIA